ncbi:hypothetical protein [Saccharopolyspora hirsuta]|nr:hypothetical protein [Saccharopolyspora hirsuta]
MHSAAFDRLRELALDPGASSQRIEEIHRFISDLKLGRYTRP